MTIIWTIDEDLHVHVHVVHFWYVLVDDSVPPRRSYR